MQSSCITGVRVGTDQCLEVFGTTLGNKHVELRGELNNLAIYIYMIWSHLSRTKQTLLSVLNDGMRPSILYSCTIIREELPGNKKLVFIFPLHNFTATGHRRFSQRSLNLKFPPWDLIWFLEDLHWGDFIYFPSSAECSRSRLALPARKSRGTFKKKRKIESCLL